MRRAVTAFLLRAGIIGPLTALSLPGVAAPFDFAPAPQNDLNRIYRIDRATGEVISCQYGLQEGTVGATLCFAAGDGAGPQAPAEYGLVPSRHNREGGVFRVNYRTGGMSVCYVFDERVVCTPQTSPAATSAPAPPQPSSGAAIRTAPMGASPAGQR